MAYYEPPATDTNRTLYQTIAAGHVQDLAPVPDPEPADYAEKAEAAEFLIYGYLKGTDGGLVKSQSARGLSDSYSDIRAIKDLIRPVMGEYFTGSAGIRMRSLPWTTSPTSVTSEDA